MEAGLDVALERNKVFMLMWKYARGGAPLSIAPINGESPEEIAIASRMRDEVFANVFSWWDLSDRFIDDNAVAFAGTRFSEDAEEVAQGESLANAADKSSMLTEAMLILLSEVRAHWWIEHKGAHVKVAHNEYMALMLRLMLLDRAAEARNKEAEGV